VHRAFCPPRSAYTEDPPAGEPKPLAPIDSLLESGKVLALKFPVGMNPGLARILGVMLKLDFQRAILQRIPQITANPTRTWRDPLFVRDESRRVSRYRRAEWSLPLLLTASAPRRNGLSRLNTRPARAPVNASTPPSQAAPHDSGSVWVANPSPYDSFIHYTSAV